MARYKTKNGLLRTEDIQFKSLKATLNRLNCKPEEVLAHITNGDWKKLQLPSPVIVAADGKGGSAERPAISVEVRQKAAAELMSYMYPKLKAVEHSGEVKSITEQRLTADEIKGILTQDPFLTAIEVKTNGPESSADDRTVKVGDSVIAADRNETGS